MPDNLRLSNPDAIAKPPGYSHVVEVIDRDAWFILLASSAWTNLARWVPPCANRSS